MKPYYEHAGITIYHGDCLELLPDIHGAVVITDPPYNAGKNYGPQTNDSRPWPEWCEWWDIYLDAMLRAAPDVLAFMSQTAYKQYIRHGARDIDWTLIWSKPLSLAVCAMPFMPHWEPIAYWGATRKRDGAFWGSDVLTCNVNRSHHGHPTEKPIELMRQLVARFEGVIVDPFAGSGTTLRAAMDLGKRAIGVEINERYCEIAASRLSQSVLQLETERPVQAGMDFAA